MSFHGHALPGHRERTPVAVWAVLVASAAAMLDLLVAAVYWGARGVAPERMFQSIAAWLLGPAAFRGGVDTVVLGALLYAGVLSVVMGLYRVLALRLPALRLHRLATGAVYGALMYGLIFLLLVPYVSAAHPAAHPLQWHALCVLAYAVLVGLPSALLARLPAA